MVAIELLAPHMASNPDFRERFEREAGGSPGRIAPHRLMA
jgi:hypothetical protein